MTLYDPTRHHESIGAPLWSEVSARNAIQALFEDTEKSFNPDGYWPAHPDDTDDGGPGPHPHLYFGSAGVVWGLKHLGERGYGKVENDYEHLLLEVRELSLKTLERLPYANKADYLRGLFIGDAGFQVALYKLTNNVRYLDRIYEIAAANLQNSVCEYMWGSAGTLAVALNYFEQTQDLRWLDLYRRGIDVLVATLVEDVALGIELWEQNIYGHQVRFLGAVQRQRRYNVVDQ